MSKIKALGIPKIKAIGLNNTNGIENPLEKSLTIKYVSCQQDNEKITLIFNVSAINLTDENAEFFFKEVEIGSSESVNYATAKIPTNGNVQVIHRFFKTDLDKLSKSFLEGDFEFEMIIICDGQSAKTDEFTITCTPLVKEEECEKESVPKLNLSEDEKKKFISTILCESQLGNEALYEIAWVYYNRVNLHGFDSWNGMKASSAYRLKQPDYKLCTYYFGIGKEYANVQYGDFTIKSYIQTKSFKENREPKFLKLKKYIEENVFSSNPQTCFKNWEGQGYWGDLDMNTDDPNNADHDPKWYMARQYYWLQLQNKTKTKYVHIMKAGTGTSFIFHEKEIKKFFDNNPLLLPNENDVRKFKIDGILNFEL